MEKKIKLLDNEYFYGGAIDDGIHMPFGESFFTRDLSKWMRGNQATSILLSTKGRFIYSEEPIKFTFDKGYLAVSADSDIIFDESCNNIREAYEKVAKLYFKKYDKKLNPIMFSAPQYNTWIAMDYEPNQKKVLKYAREIINQGYKPGVLMIDDGWSIDYGVWEFDKSKFPNPKKMIEELHNLGFKVMLWEVPFISPDSKTFREVEAMGLLVKNENNETAITRWWNGFSAVLDFTNEKACKWLLDQNARLIDTYNVDGFKMDGADPEYYHDNFVYHQNIQRVHQARIYAEMGLNYDFNELRACFKVEAAPIAQRMRDKNHSWDNEGIDRLISDAICMGLMGYYYFAPDMIGGGMVPDFKRADFVFDEELFVRYTQIATFFPMMQFSLAPWKCLSKKNHEIVKKCLRIRDKIMPYLLELVDEAHNSHVPIVRSMDFEFPNSSYEKIKSQFMLGSKYLVAPVDKKGQFEKEVHIPNGTWLGSNGKIYQQGQYIIESPLDTVLYFERIK